MKRLSSLSALVLFVSSNLVGQYDVFINRNNEKFNDEILQKPIKKQYNIADGYWDDKNYDFALKIYKNIQKDVASTAFLNFKIGECYAKGTLLKNNDSALHYLALSADNVSSDLEFDVNDNTLQSAPIFAYWEYAMLLRKNHKIKEAKENFKSFEESLGKNVDSEWQKKLEREKLISPSHARVREHQTPETLRRSKPHRYLELSLQTWFKALAQQKQTNPSSLV